MKVRTWEDRCGFCGRYKAEAEQDASLKDHRNGPNACMMRKTAVDSIVVSTVYLHQNHDFGNAFGGLWYESMLYTQAPEGGAEMFFSAQERYSTKDEALVGHNRLVERLKAGETFYIEEQN